jgi:beta-lactamase class A
MRPPSARHALALLACLLALGPRPLRADDLGAEEAGPEAWELIPDPILRDMRRLDAIAPFEDLAPLQEHADPELQRQVEGALAGLGLEPAVRDGQVSVALADITELSEPRFAAVNGDQMMYAASLPKIAVLLGAFEKIAQGKLRYDAETEEKLERMIRESSNEAATEMMQKVGKEYIAHVLLSPRYRLYDPERNGGLWVGKDYAKTGVWRRDPLHNLSHGATALQVARFYYLLQTGKLVTPEYSREMKRILAEPAIEHKFVRALHRVNPDAALFRKSGTWGTYHSDSVLVERDGRAYIAVALANGARGEDWLGQIIVELDRLIFPRAS